MNFGGRLFAGRLFAGQLFGRRSETDDGIADSAGGGRVRSRRVDGEDRRGYTHDELFDIAIAIVMSGALDH